MLRKSSEKSYNDNIPVLEILKMPWIRKKYHHSSFSTNDPFRIECWTKISNENEINNDEYLPFDEFTSKVWIPQYSREEYEAFLRSDDWSFEETNYLLQLCELYDLRFFVIADRYEFLKSSEEIIENANIELPSINQELPNINDQLNNESQENIEQTSQINGDIERNKENPHSFQWKRRAIEVAFHFNV